MRRKARGASSSEKILEVVVVNFGGVQDLLQGAGLDGVMARNNHKAFVVGHRDMFALAKDIEAGTFEGSHDAFMRDLRQLWSYADFNGPQLLQTLEILDACEIRLDGVFDVVQGFLFSVALGIAAWNQRN